jgi:hypothetical protein
MIAPAVPANLGPISNKATAKKLQKLNYDLEESSASMMQYSVAQTNDQTVMGNPSQSVL